MQKYIDQNRKKRDKFASDDKRNIEKKEKAKLAWKVVYERKSDVNSLRGRGEERLFGQEVEDSNVCDET